MKRYIIVRANGPEILQHNVNDAYKSGYRPIGGPVREPSREFMVEDLWYQAMVLP